MLLFQRFNPRLLLALSKQAWKLFGGNLSNFPNIVHVQNKTERDCKAMFLC